MKNLARIIIACFAAQLLFVGIANAKVTTPKIDAKSRVFVMPDTGADGPYDEFLTPDTGADGPYDEF